MKNKIVLAGLSIIVGMTISSVLTFFYLTRNIEENGLQTMLDKYIKAEEVCGDKNVVQVDSAYNRDKDEWEEVDAFTCRSWRKASMTPEELLEEEKEEEYWDDCLTRCYNSDH